MSGWHYPDEGHRGPWDGPSYNEPSSYSPDDAPDPADHFVSWLGQTGRYPDHDALDEWVDTHNWGDDGHRDQVADHLHGEIDRDPHQFLPPSGAPTPPDPGFREGGILRQSDQWPDRVAANRVAGERPPNWKCPDCGDDHKSVPDYAECPSCGYDKVQSSGQATCSECGHQDDDWLDDRAEIDHWDDDMWEHDPAQWHIWHKQRSGQNHLAWGGGAKPNDRHNALPDGEFFRNYDPQIGMTVPESVSDEPIPGAVNIRPKDEAQGHDALVLKAEESGLGYDAIVRLSPDGKGFDVLKAL